MSGVVAMVRQTPPRFTMAYDPWQQARPLLHLGERGDAPADAGCHGRRLFPMFYGPIPDSAIVSPGRRATGADPEPAVQDFGEIANGDVRGQTPNVLAPGIDRRYNYFSSTTFSLGLNINF